MNELSSTSDDIKAQIELEQLRKDKVELTKLVEMWAPEFSVIRDPLLNDVVISARVNKTVIDFKIDESTALYYSEPELILMTAEKFSEIYVTLLKHRITTIVTPTIANIKQFSKGKP